MKKIQIPENIAKLFRDKNKIIKLDVGSGENQEPGFINMDYRKLPGVDIVQDLEKFPWPIPDCAVTLVMARQVVEHINPAHGLFLKFMDECWRVLKVDGQMMIATPYAGSEFYWQDPTHCNGCTPTTWQYFDPLTAQGIYYHQYHPKPWKILNCFYQVNGSMEVLLAKRRDDPAYLKI